MEFFYAVGGFFPLTLLLLGLFALIAMAAAGRRAEADPSGRRPFAVYLLAVMFISLFTTAGAVAQVGGTLASTVNSDVSLPVPEPLPPVATLEPVEEITPEHSYSGFAPSPPDRMLSEILEAVLVGLLSAAIFEFHRRRWNALLRMEAPGD